jgi:hypothetical protein
VLHEHDFLEKFVIIKQARTLTHTHIHTHKSKVYADPESVKTWNGFKFKEAALVVSCMNEDRSSKPLCEYMRSMYPRLHAPRGLPSHQYQDSLRLGVLCLTLLFCLTRLKYAADCAVHLQHHFERAVRGWSRLCCPTGVVCLFVRVEHVHERIRESARQCICSKKSCAVSANKTQRYTRGCAPK